jgi:hypothetical protein
MIVSENQITQKMLVDTFKNAFIEVSEQADDYFYVEISPVSIRISIDSDRKFIRMAAPQFLNNISKEQAMTYANTMNDDYIFMKAYVVDSKDRILFIFQQDISYDVHLVAAHLVKGAKLFSEITAHAFNKYLN